jgi:hypothetical protein
MKQNASLNNEYQKKHITDFYLITFDKSSIRSNYGPVLKTSSTIR